RNGGTETNREEMSSLLVSVALLLCGDTVRSVSFVTCTASAAVALPPAARLLSRSHSTAPPGREWARSWRRPGRGGGRVWRRCGSPRLAPPAAARLPQEDR